MMDIIPAVFAAVGLLTCILFAIKFAEFFVRGTFNFINNVTATHRARRELRYVQDQLEKCLERELVMIRENEMLQAALDKLTGEK